MLSLDFAIWFLSMNGDAMLGHAYVLQLILVPTCIMMSCTIELSSIYYTFNLWIFTYIKLSNFSGAVLYLEWAPSNILSQNVKAVKDGPAGVVSDENIKSLLLEQSIEGLTEDEIDPDRAEVRCLLVFFCANFLLFISNCMLFCVLQFPCTIPYAAHY